MKIGFFTDSYLPLPDGVATSVDSCARALEERGHEVYIIAPKKPRYKDKRSNVYRLTSIKFIKTPEIRWALQLPEKSLIKILRIDFDIIHGHAGGPITFLGWQIARARNIPYIATYHTHWSRYAHYFLKGIVRPRMLEITTRIFGNMYGNLIAPTKRIKKELISYGVKSNIFVLPTGIDINKFDIDNKDYIRKKIKATNDTGILLYVGRLGREKSVDFLLQSFKIIKENNPQTALVLVGSGPEKNKLKKLAKKLNIQNNVFFLGTIKYKNISKVYKGADLFVFASQTETQGMVILEAFASGLPVVALEDETFDGVIINNKNGFLVKKDVNIFSEKVIKILNNEKMRTGFSEFGKNTVKNFLIESTAKKLEELYREIAKEKGEKTPNINARRLFNKLKRINLKKFLPKDIAD